MIAMRISSGAGREGRPGRAASAFVKGALLASTIALGLSAGATQAVAKDIYWNPTPDDIHKAMARRLESNFTRTDIDLKKGERGRLFGWSWGYIGRAALLLHEATGEERFKAMVRDTSYRLLEHRDDALGIVDPVRGRVMPSWTAKYPFGGHSTEITTAGLIALPMCQYAVKFGDHTLGREAVKTLKAFIAERREAHGGYYYFHDVQGEVEAINHANIYGTALAHCAQLPYAPASFTETALGIYRYWRHFTRPDGAGLSWPYMPGPDSPQDIEAEAFWKYAVTLELPVALVKLGLMKDDGIIDQLRRTWRENPIIKAGGIARYLGERKDVDMTDEERFQGRSLAGLMSTVVLLEDPVATEQFLTMMRRHPKYFPHGWFGGSKSMFFTYGWLKARGMAVTPAKPVEPSTKVARKRKPRKAPKDAKAAKRTRLAGQARRTARKGPARASQCRDALKAPFLFSTDRQARGEITDFVERRLTGERYTTIGLGDSIMQRWPNELLKVMYGGDVLNAGFGGDGIPQMRHRFRTMSFARQSPDKVVIHVGTNDLRRNASGCAVGHGILEAVSEVQATSPSAEVVVHAILPRGDYLTELAGEIGAANAALVAAAPQHGFTVVDMSAPLLARCSATKACDYMREAKNIHPTLTAYQAMADALKGL